MRESELLRHIIAGSRVDPGVLVGPGDDGAVVETRPGDRLVLTVDQLVQGRHFTEGTPIDLVARKAVARSISDLAAMAAEPAWSLATGALPPGYPQQRATELVDRMHHWARHFACPLIGGDLATTHHGELVLTVTAIGRLLPGVAPPLRSAARVGDWVCVTGELGGAFDARTGLGKHLTFEPRLRESLFLARFLGDRLGAMMDISDGLGRDAGRIGAASGVRVVLEEGALPVASGATLEGALADGEDYELLFTVAPGGPLPAMCPGTNVRITRIGRVDAASGDAGAFVQSSSGELRRVDDEGWDHGDPAEG
ncbi:MAG: thiamine-phosphate kinase [Phycisphaerales bacterium]